LKHLARFHDVVQEGSGVSYSASPPDAHIDTVEVLRMIPKTISAILVCVLLHSSVVAESAEQSQTQTVTNMQQVLHKAQERNKDVKVTLRKKIDNQRKFTGSIVEISIASRTWGRPQE